MTGVQTCALPICFPVTIWAVCSLMLFSKVDHVDSASGLVDSLSSVGVNTVVDVVSSPQVQSASELVSTFIS